MNFQIENYYDERSTSSTMDEEEKKTQKDLSETTSHRKRNFFDYNGTIHTTTVGNDKIEIYCEAISANEINNLFNHNIMLHPLEEDLNFDILTHYEYPRQSHDIVIEIHPEENNPENPNSARDFALKIINIFLNNKIKRDEIKKKFPKKDNGRKTIARYFFNHYLKILVEIMENKCHCKIFFDSFPEKLIFEAKRNKNFLNYTFEYILEIKASYENKMNGNLTKEVIKNLNSKENKDIMESSGYAKILKMTFLNLYEDFLKSNEYIKHIEDLIENKSELEAEKFVYFSQIFVEGYKKK
jgi:hypothetical protein